MNEQVTIIGAGLAGSEAAWTLAQAGIPVVLQEMKPQRFSPAHESEGFAELVCSNSLKAIRTASAGGLLKAEMRLLGSLLLQCAAQTQVPAGGALAVDRNAFSALVTKQIESHPLIRVERGEVTHIPKEGYVMVATGPLTSDSLADDIVARTGTPLSFYDAAAPIIEAASIQMEQVFYAARYDRGEADYINCPFTKPEYEAFHEALIHAEGVELATFEQNITVYEGCMPIEILAKRGIDTLRFGPLKPVGLIDPRTDRRPWAVVQLRLENTEGSLYNMVGFQTNLKFPEQKRVFSMIPGLKAAEFARYGVMHRNTFIDSPRLLASDFSYRKESRLYFIGQLTGVEGYMESAASGIIAAHQLVRTIQGKPALFLPRSTMLGALTSYISNPAVENFQPMGANMGILPMLVLPEGNKKVGKQVRYEKLAQRALAELEATLQTEKEKAGEYK